MKVLIALLAGLLFGAGLVLGGMTRPEVVLGFLDAFGRWNPQLVFVMGGAVATTALGYAILRRRARPAFDAQFHWPTRRSLDPRLLGGAALFGIGWGIAGYCPGPALASLAAGAPSVVLFVACMAAGWWLASRIPAAARP